MLLFSSPVRFSNRVEEKHLGAACYAHSIGRFKKETPEFAKVNILKTSFIYIYIYIYI
jgi:hypothetical protein